ncbi:hypothetical protein JST56_06315 [Candidatus Dependentiae bacterium]|jgi:hypothetical protein|nr:hypothetical protein [Candidatus Dependentiae bacterium]
MAFMNYRTLLSFVFLFVFPWCVQAYPSALYLLECNDQTIVIWSDDQVCIPVANVDKSIKDILDFFLEKPEQYKVIVRKISPDYDRKSREKIGKHEHEADYAFESLVLDTLVSRLKDLPKILIVEGSQDDVVNQTTAACLSSPEECIAIFVDTPVAAKVAEQLVQNGFTQELTTS